LLQDKLISNLFIYSFVKCLQLQRTLSSNFLTIKTTSTDFIDSHESL
jgi:hypothetical protein